MNRAAISNTLSLIVLFCLIFGTGFYLYYTRPCARPIYYDIGSFSTQFDISQSTFLTDAAEAASLWNQAAGHTVLAYKAGGSLPINLIYDNRQQTADTGVAVANQESALGTQKSQLGALQSQYTAEAQQIASDKAAGKSPATINSEIDSLNQLGSEINSQTANFNSKVSQVNSVANAYNSQAGTDFDEGEYVKAYGSTYINIYEFTDHTQLVRILAHEMGHSLGLAHNPNPASIMYPENKATTIALSSDDMAELSGRCALTIQNLNPFTQVNLSSE
jgi:predicted Zn-dependent protease